MRKRKLRNNIKKLYYNTGLFITASIAILIISGIIYLSKDITPTIKHESHNLAIIHDY
jgi:hypothetical protein